LGWVADHGAVETGVERLLEHLGGMPAGLQRHRRERHQERIGLHAREHVRVEIAAPVGALVRRDVVAEQVEPAAHHLPVNAARGEPALARIGVAHAAGHRTLGVVARECETVAAVRDGHLHRRKGSFLRGDLIQEGGWDVVRMRVNDHGTRSPSVPSRTDLMRLPPSAGRATGRGSAFPAIGARSQPGKFGIGTDA
jgi:hypothetical protein